MIAFSAPAVRRGSRGRTYLQKMSYFPSSRVEKMLSCWGRWTNKTKSAHLGELFLTRAAEQSRSRSWCWWPELTRGTELAWTRSPSVFLIMSSIALSRTRHGFLENRVNVVMKCVMEQCVPKAGIYQEALQKSRQLIFLVTYSSTGSLPSPLSRPGQKYDMLISICWLHYVRLLQNIQK